MTYEEVKTIEENNKTSEYKGETSYDNTKL